MTIEELIGMANRLKAGIREVQNDHTGEAYRDMRNTLSEAYDGANEALAALFGAQEQMNEVQLCSCCGEPCNGGEYCADCAEEE